MLNFMVEGGLEAVRRILPRVTYAHRAANLEQALVVESPR